MTEPNRQVPVDPPSVRPHSTDVGAPDSSDDAALEGICWGKRKLIVAVAIAMGILLGVVLARTKMTGAEPDAPRKALLEVDRAHGSQRKTRGAPAYGTARTKSVFHKGGDGVDPLGPAL